jgi:autotransporter-associated beta strand protein
MKPSHTFRSFFIGCSSLLAASSLHAASVTWDITPGTIGSGDSAITGGTGAWNTTNGNWTTDAGANNIAWVNGNNDTAIFGDTAGTVTLGTGITVGGLQFDAATYTVTGNTLTFGAAGNIAANSNALISSVIAGGAAAAIKKTGAGELELTATNTFAGQLTVESGKLVVNSLNNNAAAGRLGNSSLSVILGASGQTGTLKYTGGNVTSTKRFTIAAGGTGVFEISSVATTAANISGAIDGSGALSKTGPGTLQLSANSSYTGILTVSEGTLKATGNNNAMGVTPATLVLNGGTTLDFPDSSGRTFFRGTTIAGNATIIPQKNAAGPGVLYTLNTLAIGANTLTVSGGNVNSGLASLRFSGTTTLTGTATFDIINPVAGGGTVLTLNGAVGDSGQGFIKDGNGTLVLNAANTYTGSTAVNNGILQFNNSGFAAAARSVTVAAGATVAAGYAIDDTFLNRVAENSNAFTVALGINSANALDFNTSTGATLPNASLGAVGSFTYSGALTPNGTTYRLGGGGGTLTVDSILTGSGNSLVVSGPGTVILSGANDYGGATTVSSGTLQFASAAAIGSTSGISPAAGTIVAAGYDADQTFLTPLTGSSNAFTVALAANVTNNLDFSAGTGANLSNASLGATGAFSYSGNLTPFGTTYRLGGGGGTLTVTSNLTGAGNSLVVSGPGTVVLSSAANSFAGSVTVSSGTLQVNSAGAFNNIARNVAVNTGGTITFSAANAAQAASVTVDSGATANFTAATAGNGSTVAVSGTANVTVSNALNSSAVTVNTGGILQAPQNTANAYNGAAINLNGGTFSFGHTQTTVTAPTGYASGGNFLVSANSVFNSFRAGSAGTTGADVIIAYGSLDFAADGLTLNLTDTGISFNFQPAGAVSQFTGSIFSRSGTINFVNTYNTIDSRGVPTLALVNTGFRAGKTLTVTNNTGTDGSLSGSLGVNLLGGAEMLASDSFTIFNGDALAVYSDTSTFDTTNSLWTKSNPTAKSIAATLASPVGTVAAGGSATFASEDAGNVSLTGLTINDAYKLTLTLASPGDQATVMAQLAKNAAFSSIAAVGADKVSMEFTAPAATSYFAWDNFHTAPADWFLGGNLTGVALATVGGGGGPTAADNAVSIADFSNSISFNPTGGGGGNGLASGSFAGFSGGTYTVQYSPDLGVTPWAPVAGATSIAGTGTSGTAGVQIPWSFETNGATKAFFRLVITQ